MAWCGVYFACLWWGNSRLTVLAKRLYLFSLTVSCIFACPVYNDPIGSQPAHNFKNYWKPAACILGQGVLQVVLKLTLAWPFDSRACSGCLTVTGVASSSLDSPLRGRILSERLGSRASGPTLEARRWMMRFRAASMQHLLHRRQNLEIEYFLKVLSVAAFWFWPSKVPRFWEITSLKSCCCFHTEVYAVAATSFAKGWDFLS